MPSNQQPTRRSILGILAGLGIGTQSFQRALAAQAGEGEITVETIKQAEWIAGITLSDDQRETAKRSLKALDRRNDAIRGVELEYDVPPAFHFEPLPYATAIRSAPVQRNAVPMENSAGVRPASDEDLAFLPLAELTALIRTRQ